MYCFSNDNYFIEYIEPAFSRFMLQKRSIRLRSMNLLRVIWDEIDCLAHLLYS